MCLALTALLAIGFAGPPFAQLSEKTEMASFSVRGPVAYLRGGSNPKKVITYLEEADEGN